MDYAGRDGGGGGGGTPTPDDDDLTEHGMIAPISLMAFDNVFHI